MKTTLQNLLIGLALLAGVTLACVQGSAFTYQGRLNDTGGPATGRYHLRFTLYDTAVNGAVVAGPATNNAVDVTNGLFTLALDFGAGVFTGPDRWLDITVRTNGGSAFVILAPRQKLTPTPMRSRRAI
jgi:hypothetical protein